MITKLRCAKCYRDVGIDCGHDVDKLLVIYGIDGPRGLAFSLAELREAVRVNSPRVAVNAEPFVSIGVPADEEHRHG